MRPLKMWGRIFLLSRVRLGVCKALFNELGRRAAGVLESEMVSIRLPDGSSRQYDHPVTVAEVAASIGAGLAKAALGGKLDGELVDTSTLIDHDASLAIVTEKDADGLDIIRHSTAHLLAYAVKDLYPDAQVTIGPVIENGFYYDFAYSRPFTPEDPRRSKSAWPKSRRRTSRCRAGW